MNNLKDKTIKLREDNVTLVSIENKAVMLDVMNRCSYDPNETAYFILKLMENGISIDEMKMELLSRFDADDKRASQDLDAFIDDLLTLDLIEIREDNMVGRGGFMAIEDKKAYQSPRLGHPSEIAIAAAQAVPTPKSKIA
jgi:translation initiation factor 2 beta subunit (eIF-2beta)/eIF-5